MHEKKYGLQLRVPKPQQKQRQVRPPVPKPVAFNDDDDDDVEREISRQAAKNKSLKEVEQQHQKALEEDPSVFDYDGVYDDMKAKIAQPRAQDRQQRQPKYIQMLMEKAKQREREHEIVYERKLAKERGKEDHLYSDKDKFVTSAYKRKLAEQAKWMEEERMRELREQRDDVTKKSDITDFYFSLSKNVAYGAQDKPESKKSESEKSEKTQEKEASTFREEHQNQPPGHEKEKPESDRHELKQPERHEKQPGGTTTPFEHPSTGSPVTSTSRSEDQREMGPNATPASDQQPPNDQPKRDHHKKSEDALAAAKERFLARKKAKMQ